MKLSFTVLKMCAGSWSDVGGIIKEIKAHYIAMSKLNKKLGKQLGTRLETDCKCKRPCGLIDLFSTRSVSNRTRLLINTTRCLPLS